jgi:hypothetical protein
VEESVQQLFAQQLIETRVLVSFATAAAAAAAGVGFTASV